MAFLRIDGERSEDRGTAGARTDRKGVKAEEGAYDEGVTAAFGKGQVEEEAVTGGRDASSVFGRKEVDDDAGGWHRDTGSSFTGGGRPDACIRGGPTLCERECSNGLEEEG